MKANGEDYNNKSSNQQTINAVAPIQELLSTDYVKSRFNDVMGVKAPAFLASLANIVNTNKDLKQCSQSSVVSAALVAAVLDLPIEPNLGFAAIIPYYGKTGQVAQFQIMYKGFIQLAMRTGQYRTMNVTEVYTDELKGYNLITGEVDIKSEENGFREQGKENKIVGYAAYFRLVNGFEKTVYWTIKKLEEHGKKYSKSYSGNYPEKSLWSTNKPAMYSKTVIKDLISKWGIMSTTMQTAVIADQGVMKNLTKEITAENIEYVDNDGEVPEKSANASDESKYQTKTEPVKEEPEKETKVEEQKPVVVEAKQEVKKETVKPVESTELPGFSKDGASKAFDSGSNGQFDIF
jgi:recombination protein RecT